MSKSLFDTELKSKGIPSLLPTDDGTVVDTNPITESKPQIITKEENKPITESTPVQMSGSFFIKGGELIADVRLEFDAKHPLYGLYINKLKDFVQECEKVHVLKSSSGI